MVYMEGNTYILLDVLVLVSLGIFTSCAVFWRTRRASENTNKRVQILSDTTHQNV